MCMSLLADTPETQEVVAARAIYTHGDGNRGVVVNGLVKHRVDHGGVHFDALYAYCTEVL